MIAYFFRFLEDGKPTGWIGFAVAANQDDMFWQIDEHGDPHSCEIQTADRFSWCGIYNPSTETFDDQETSESALCVARREARWHNKWRKPYWVTATLDTPASSKRKLPTWAHEDGAPF